MADKTKNEDTGKDLKCPECRGALKRRRTRNPDECEMVCGGCGQSFDVCDLDIVDKLKQQS